MDVRSVVLLGYMIIDTSLPSLLVSVDLNVGVVQCAAFRHRTVELTVPRLIESGSYIRTSRSSEQTPCSLKHYQRSAMSTSCDRHVALPSSIEKRSALCSLLTRDYPYY